MSSTTPPPSYTLLPFTGIQVLHVPADAPTATPVLIVAFNRPEKYNAVTDSLLAELEHVYRLIDADDRVRTVVLTGNGKAFCAGADLEIGFSGIIAHKATEESRASYRDSGGRVALSILHCSKPTIVALNGPAAGFGLTITLPCAIRVACSSAKIALPFSQRGVTFESIASFFLPRILGLGRATHIATTGAAYTASDPLVRGLFSALLPTPQETVEYAVRLAGEIAGNTSVTSTKLMRDMLVWGPTTPEETHRLDSRVFLEVVGGRDNEEGVRSFVEKRRAVFGGRFEREKLGGLYPWWEEGRKAVEEGKGKAKI
ncbi:ClpP/crotonase-like domain-containing protein [Staphylotrichum tortipilum]|uniref:ClpP/crotonase-like domain-containing protein n=1 Tax=Staphylotrichum tortipilum TaxID=2831512 RepID=A0AAN6MM83_9PEZI|nr:ClpP/crotonase-like domain-containing protein [Staphylotrichum longicolle]